MFSMNGNNFGLFVKSSRRLSNMRDLSTTVHFACEIPPTALKDASYQQLLVAAEEERYSIREFYILITLVEIGKSLIFNTGPSNTRMVEIGRTWKPFSKKIIHGGIRVVTPSGPKGFTAIHHAFLVFFSLAISKNDISSIMISERSVNNIQAPEKFILLFKSILVIIRQEMAKLFIIYSQKLSTVREIIYFDFFGDLYSSISGRPSPSKDKKAGIF